MKMRVYRKCRSRQTFETRTSLTAVQRVKHIRRDFYLHLFKRNVSGKRRVVLFNGRGVRRPGFLLRHRRRSRPLFSFLPTAFRGLLRVLLVIVVAASVWARVQVLRAVSYMG